MKYKILIRSILITLSLVIAHSSFAGQLGNFMYTNSLNYPRAGNVAVLVGDTVIYTFGEDYFSNDTPLPVERATIRSDGTLTPWTVESERYSTVRFSGVGAYVNGYLYAIGGENFYGYDTTAERAHVNPDGTLGQWTTIGTVPGGFSDSSWVQTSTFLYVIGGPTYSPGPYVYRAATNPDGSLGTWILCTSQLAGSHSSQGAIVINTTLYVLDGVGPSPNNLVQEAYLYPDGELSAFSTVNSTEGSHAYNAVVYDNPYLYYIECQSGLPGFSYSEKAQVYPDGSLGSWEYVPSLQLNDPRVELGFVTTPNAAYAVGGYDQGGDSPNVEYASIIPSIPTFPTFPSLKLFSNQSIYHAFNIEDYNTRDIATSYSILSNFLDLTSLDSSSINQASYDSPTTGMNIYLADNAYGEGTATNEVKYSTYKIYKLPKVGLTVGSSWDVNVAKYTYDSIRLAIPPSFGNPDALSVGDPSGSNATTLVSATWLGNTVIHITSLHPFSGAVEVYVTASPNTTSPFGTDIDKERIQVYTNLLSNSTFSTSNDTSIWMPFELAPGRTTLATQSWMSSYTDSAGTQATGVWKFNFPNGNTGVKSTPKVSNWVPMSTGQWYTVRMRLVADTPDNAHQLVLYGFNNYLGTGLQTDVAANVLFGIPKVWTWEETPLLVHGTSTGGYPQFQFKASTSGNIYIDEIQIINSAPTLVDANRNNTRLFYAYGNFTSSSETTGWGQQIYNGAGSAPEISVSNDELVLTFNTATSGTGQQGIKWTANNGIQGMGAATFSATPGRQVGVRATVTLPVGTFNSSGIILIAAYGVHTSGQQTIGTTPSNLSASAGVGALVGGTYRTVASAVNPYYQLQFGVLSDQPGTLTITDIDLDRDMDDPNFGDATLFP